MLKSRGALHLLIVLATSLITVPALVYFFGGEGSRVSGAPEIEGIHSWINSEPILISQSRGKVILLDFWTYSCINCLRTIPYLKAWDEKYRQKGLIIVGIHSPEFTFEKDYERVKKAVEDYGIRYPVALDSDKKTWKAYASRFWPHKYLLDTQGNLRYEQIGEGGYLEFEKKIQELLSESRQSPAIPLTPELSEKVDFKEIKTPEIYLGYGLGQFLGNPLGVITGRASVYKEPETLEDNLFYLDGKWEVREEFIRHTGEGDGTLRLRYTAKSLNMVVGGPGRGIWAEVFLDGRPLKRTQSGQDIQFTNAGLSRVWINDIRLYRLVDSPEGYESHTVTLKVRGPGLEGYTFTFG